MVNRSFDGLFRRTLNRPESWAPAGLEGHYVVVDGARDSRIFDALPRDPSEVACLYDGELSPRLARSAPCIVRLVRGSRFANAYYDYGWGEAWGIVLRTDASIAAVRRHLRTLAYVLTDTGAKVVFRYYDARVLRIFLPTCDAEQLDQMFGPIEAFVLDHSGASTPRVLSRDPLGQLQTEMVH